MAIPTVKLNQGIHVMHLFYRIDRVRWAQLGEAASTESRKKLEALCAANANVSHPKLVTYANVGAKADLVFMIYAAELGLLSQIHREIEACFAPGVLQTVFSFLSVTELSEYMPTEEESRQMLIQQEKLLPESEEFKTRMAESAKRRTESTLPALS